MAANRIKGIYLQCHLLNLNTLFQTYFQSVPNIFIGYHGKRYNRSVRSAQTVAKR